MTTSIKTHSEIPFTHKDSWKKYNNHKWVYETTRLLDMQHIKWSPYDDYNMLLEPFNYGETTYQFISHKTNTKALSADIPNGTKYNTFVAISKGEIKHIAHYDEASVTTEINGDIELRISAMISLHFKKFSGIIDVISIDKNIIGVNLFISDTVYDSVLKNDSDLEKHIVRIYNNRPWGK